MYKEFNELDMKEGNCVINGNLIIHGLVDVRGNLATKKITNQGIVFCTLNLRHNCLPIDTFSEENQNITINGVLIIGGDLTVYGQVVNYGKLKVNGQLEAIKIRNIGIIDGPILEAHKLSSVRQYKYNSIRDSKSYPHMEDSTDEDSINGQKSKSRFQRKNLFGMTFARHILSSIFTVLRH